MFISLISSTSFRKRVITLIVVSFILVSRPVGVFAAAVDKDSLRETSVTQSENRNTIVNELGVAKQSQEVRGRLKQRAIQSGIAYLIQQRDLATINAIDAADTASLVKTRWGKFAAGHDLFQALINNQKAVIAANVVDYNQIEGHLRAAMERNCAIILEAARSQLGYALDEKKVVEYIKEVAKKLKCTVPIVVHGDHIQYTQDLFGQQAILKAAYEAAKGAGTYKADMKLEDVPLEVLESVQKKLTENIAKERVVISNMIERLLKAGFTSIAIDASTIFDEYAGNYVSEYYLANGTPEEKLVVQLEKGFYLPLEWGAKFLKADPEQGIGLFNRIRDKVVADMQERKVSQADIDKQVKRMTEAFAILTKEANKAGLDAKAVIAAYDKVEKEISAATIAHKLPEAVLASLTDKEKLMIIPGSNVEETAFQLKKIDEIIASEPALAWLNGRIGKEIEVGHVDKKVPNPRNDNKLEAKLTHPMAVRVMKEDLREYFKNSNLSYIFDVIATNNGSQHGSKYGSDLKPVSKVGVITPFLTAELAEEVADVNAAVAQHGTSGSDLGEQAYQAKNGIIKFNIATLYQQILLNALSVLDDGVSPFDLPKYCQEHLNDLIWGLSVSCRQKMLKIAGDLKAGTLSQNVDEKDSDFMKFLKLTYAWGIKKNKITASSDQVKIAQLFAQEFKRSFKQMDPVLKSYGQATPVIGIVTGGGDAPGLNGLLHAAVRRAMEKQVRIVPIYEGFKGGLDNDLVAKSATSTLRLPDVEDDADLGGTVIKTSRTNPWSPDRLKKGDNLKLVENLKTKLGLDGLGGGGGDDTATSLRNLCRLCNEIYIVGTAKTVDYDIELPFGADTFGFDSMVESGVPYVRNVIRTAKSLKRVMNVEVMGRAAGFLTAYMSARAGGTAALIPEKTIDIEELIHKLGEFYNAQRLNSNEKNEYGVVLISEGAFIDPTVGNNKYWMDKAFTANPVAKAAYEACLKKFEKDKTAGKVDEFAHPKLENMGLIMNAIEKVGLEELYKIKDTTLVGKIDYGHRGAKVSDRDRAMVESLGAALVDAIMTGETGQLLYVHEGVVKKVPFEEIITKDPKTGEDHIATRTFDWQGAHKEIWALANLADGISDTTMDTPALLAEVEKTSKDIHAKLAVEPQYLGAVKAVSNYQLALVIGANVVYENGGTLEALAQIKTNASARVVFWSDNAVDIEKLKAIGADKVTDGYSDKGLKDALTQVAAVNIPPSRVAVINSETDFEKVKEEYKVEYIDDFQFQNPELQAIMLKMPEPNMNTRVNAMPLVFARAISGIVANDETVNESVQETVKKEYKDFVANYAQQVNPEALKQLNNLTVQLEAMPTVKVGDEVVMLANSYEQTVSKI